jgi:hypothetical protein
MKGAMPVGSGDWLGHGSTNKFMKMQIHDYHPTAMQLDACISRMKSAPFRAADIQQAAEQVGVPSATESWIISARVADRLIQKFRKSGNIKISKYPTWTWVA